VEQRSNQAKEMDDQRKEPGGEILEGMPTEVVFFLPF